MDKQSQNNSIIIAGGFTDPSIAKQLLSDQCTKIDTFLSICDHVNANALVIPEHLPDTLKQKITSTTSIPLITNALEEVTIPGDPDIVIYDSEYINDTYTFRDDCLYINLRDDLKYSDSIPTVDFTLSRCTNSESEKWHSINDQSNTHSLYLWQQQHFPVMYVILTISNDEDQDYITYNHNFRWYFDYLNRIN